MVSANSLPAPVQHPPPHDVPSQHAGDEDLLLFDLSLSSGAAGEQFRKLSPPQKAATIEQLAGASLSIY